MVITNYESRSNLSLLNDIPNFVQVESRSTIFLASIYTWQQSPVWSMCMHVYATVWSRRIVTTLKNKKNV